jgi:hypothetical protein
LGESNGEIYGAKPLGLVSFGAKCQRGEAASPLFGRRKSVSAPSRRSDCPAMRDRPKSERFGSSARIIIPLCHNVLDGAGGFSVRQITVSNGQLL